MDRMVEIPDTRASRGRGTSNGVADGSNVVLGVRDSLTGTLVVEGNVRILGSVEGEVLSVGRDGASDAVSFVEAGVPAVEFGPRGGGHHGPEEWVSVSSLVRYREALSAFVHALPAAKAPGLRAIGGER